MKSAVKEKELSKINYSMSSPGIMFRKNDNMIQNGHIAIRRVNGKKKHMKCIVDQNCKVPPFTSTVRVTVPLT